MQAVLELGRGNLIHRAMPRDAAHSLEGRCGYSDAKMGFALTVKLFLMTGMAMAFIDNLQPQGVKLGFQLLFEPGFPVGYGSVHDFESPAAKSQTGLLETRYRKVNSCSGACEGP
jgi:hypothetical protein